MFGSKKPTESDVAQDRQLKQLMKNQKVLIPNNNYLVKQNTALWKWVKWLEAQVKTLESRMTMNERKDAERSSHTANLFKGLAEASSKESTVEVQASNVEAGTTS